MTCRWTGQSNGKYLASKEKNNSLTLLKINMFEWRSAITRHMKDYCAPFAKDYLRVHRVEQILLGELLAALVHLIAKLFDNIVQGDALAVAGDLFQAARSGLDALNGIEDAAHLFDRGVLEVELVVEVVQPVGNLRLIT